MSKDEAIDILRCRKDGDAADALEILLRIAEAQPCEDCVSRAEAIRIANGYCHPSNIAKELAKLPSVQPEREKDIPKPVTIENGFVKCGGCNMYIRFPIADRYSYCPECGQAIEWIGERGDQE